MTNSPSIRQFKKEITKKYIKSSNEEIISMLKEGNINDVVNSLLPMVIYVVDKFNYQNDNEFEELISVGNMGLMKGINRFDLNKSDNIISYCKFIIRFEILQYLTKNKDFIKLPSTSRELKKKVILPTMVEVDDITTLDYIDEEYNEITIDKQELGRLLITIPNIEYKEVMLFLDYYFLLPKVNHLDLYKKHKIRKRQLYSIVDKVINEVKNNPQLTEKFRDLFF